MSTRDGKAGTAAGNEASLKYGGMELDTSGANHYLHGQRENEYGPASQFSANQDPMQQQFHDWFVNQWDCDVTLKLCIADEGKDDEQTQVAASLGSHSLFLRMFSGYFRDMPYEREDMVEQPVLARCEEHVQAFRAAIEWCYTQRIPTGDPALCYSLLCVASEWRMAKLTEQVLHWVQSAQLSAAQVARMCKRAFQCGCTPVYHQAVQMLADRWEQVVAAGDAIDLGYMNAGVFCTLVSQAVAQNDNRLDEGLGEVVGRYLRTDNIVELCDEDDVEYLTLLMGQVEHNEEAVLLRLCLATQADPQSLCMQMAGKLQTLVDEDKMDMNALPVDVVVQVLSQDEMTVNSEDVVLGLVRQYVAQHDGDGEEQGWEKRVFGCVRCGLLSADVLKAAKKEIRQMLGADVYGDALEDCMSVRDGGEPENCTKRMAPAKEIAVKPAMPPTTQSTVNPNMGLKRKRRGKQRKLARKLALALAQQRRGGKSGDEAGNEGVSWGEA